MSRRRKKKSRIQKRKCNTSKKRGSLFTKIRSHKNHRHDLVRDMRKVSKLRQKHSGGSLCTPVFESVKNRGRTYGVFDTIMYQFCKFLLARNEYRQFLKSIRTHTAETQTSFPKTTQNMQTNTEFDPLTTQGTQISLQEPTITHEIHTNTEFHPVTTKGTQVSLRVPVITHNIHTNTDLDPVTTQRTQRPTMTEAGTQNFAFAPPRRYSSVGDGNCFFNSMAMLLYAKDNDSIMPNKTDPEVLQAARTLRSRVAAELRSNPDRYKEVLFPEPGETYEDLVKTIETDKNWSGQAEVIAFAEATGIPIHVAAAGENKLMEGVYRPKFQTTKKPLAVFFTGNHYEPII